jgi:hypothetical protein
MKKILLSIFLLILVFFAAQAQRRNGLIGHRTQSSGSLVFTLGPNYSFADPDCSKGVFGPVINQDFFQNQSVTFGYRYTFSDDFGYKVALGYDHFTGEDLKTGRDFVFKTNAFQLSGQGEYYYHFGKKFRRRWPNSVYGFLGVGVMASNAQLDRPATGNRDYKYRQNDVTPVVPYGIGYKYDIDYQFSVGAEFSWRYTFSDYLDGFKPPYPSSKSNDVLQGLLLTLSYKLE